MKITYVKAINKPGGCLVDNLLYITRDCGPRWNSHLAIKHLEYTPELRVLYDHKRAVAAGTPHREEKAKTSRRICYPTSICGDRFSLGRLVAFAQVCMSFEVAGRVFIICAINMLRWIP